ncbi:MAG: hypothetical protein RL345_185 [Chloroflexota bacterium]|jgi:hypothetical protein
MADTAPPEEAPIPDPPMPLAVRPPVTPLRRPPRIFRTMREWIQNRLMAVVTALGEFIFLFAFVLSVILGAIFVLNNRIINQTVRTPSVMPGGTYAPDGRAQYSSGASGKAFAIAFVDGIARKPVPISPSGLALPAVRPKLADEAKAENALRDAANAAANALFTGSADTKAALSAPILSGKLLGQLQAAKAGGMQGDIVIPTRGTGPPPTPAARQPTQTPPPTNTPVADAATPTTPPTRPAGTSTPLGGNVSPTPPPAPPTNSPAPSATPVPQVTATPIPVVTSSPVPTITVAPSSTAPPTPIPSATAPLVSPSPSVALTTPTVPILPSVTAPVATPTSNVPPTPSVAPTVAVSPTSGISPTSAFSPTTTVTITPTVTPTETPTPTPTRAGGPSPTALAVVDFSTLVAVPGQPVITSFPGIFSSASASSSGTGGAGPGTPAPIPIGPKGRYERTLLFVNGGSRPIDFLPSTGGFLPAVGADGLPNPLFSDAVNGLQLEITVGGEIRYRGPIDVTLASSPPSLERIQPNGYAAVGIAVYLPVSAPNSMSRQTVTFNLDFTVSRF